MAQALASVADVKRILRLTDTDAARDANIAASLAAVASRLEPLFKHLAVEGPVVESFFDVHEDATLWIGTGDATVTLVEVFTYPDSRPIAIAQVSVERSSGYDLTDDGAVILRPGFLYEPFEGAVASRLPRTYARVDVHYQSTGVVPKAVTEGVALLSAGYYKEGPSVLTATLKSEKIGDYSYTNDGGASASGDESSYGTLAWEFLEPYLRKRKVLVT